MESNYSNRDFEQFVKQNADQYRMFPSEKVWKNIHNSLHTRRRWYGAGLAFLLLLTAGSVTWVMVTSPASGKQQPPVEDKFQANNTIQSSPENSATTENTNKPDINDLLVFDKEVNNFSQQPVLAVPENNINATAVKIKDSETNNTYESVPTSFSNQERLVSENEFASHIIVTRNLNDLPLSLPDKNTITQSLEDNNEITVAEAKKDDPVSETIIDDIYPLSIESVTNAYHPNNFGKKLKWQVFITPTISYRQLTANNSVETTNSPLAYSGIGDVNNAVTHRPDLGVQIGLSAGYPVSKNLKLRGGVQFNVNRYDIKAFAYNPEIATIVDDVGGSSISAWTSYRNYGGYRTDWLKNFYFSVSVPIGAELKLFGNEKTNWGIAGTIQPTYILKDKAYLISTDYKNYAKVPWLVRRVNLSASFETFIGLGSNTKWQIGPQVRYQVLSSFQNKYPVKEHLFDFGLKVGVFLND